MSLTQELNNPTSATNRFLEANLPQRHEVIEAWPAIVSRSAFRADSYEMGHGIAPRIGTAFDMRVSLDIAQKPPHTDLLSMLPPNHYERLMEASGYCAYEPGYMSEGTTRDPVLLNWERANKPEYCDNEQVASLMACYAVAAASSLYYFDGLSVKEKRDLFYAFYPPDEQMSAEYQDEVDIAHEVLSRMWFSYLVQGRDQLLKLGDKGVVAPDLELGFAKADLVIGDTIIDIKTHRQPDFKKGFDQTLCYALLDQYDMLHLNQVGLYLGRFGMTLATKIEDVVATASSQSNLSWDDLRREYRLMIEEELRDSARRHLRRTQRPDRILTVADMDRLRK